MISKRKIPIHQDQLKEQGADILPLHGIKFTDYELHRDDHYMFIIQESGLFIFEVDFNKIELNGAAVCYVAPGQVQRYIKVDKSEGWLLFLDPDNISKPLRESFDMMLNVTQNTKLEKSDPIFTLANTLELYWSDKTRHNELMSAVTLSLMNAIVGITASTLSGASTNFKRLDSPKYLLAARFRQLIKERFQILKQVKEYASLLHITPLYLNEVMKEITGFPASYWIQQEIILEAKRLLSHSAMDIREIAWELGYEDHAYFSRFFKKHTGTTASAFRAQKP